VQAELTTAVPRHGFDPAAECQRKESGERLAAALETLDEVSRTAVVLRYFDNLSSKQIGELLELAPAAVDMRLMRARKALREVLEQDQ
jgi:RNA polymerase sigma factor (sigma-70 family)